MARRLVRLLRARDGFGLVELLIAMVILNIGLLAIMGTFLSGAVATSHTSRVATASTLADTQMELYRALTYSVIAIDPSSIPTSPPYTSDAAYSGSQVTGTCSGSWQSTPQCNASQAVTGPDHLGYEVDTYIVSLTPENGRAVKQVTVVVRDTTNLAATLVRRASLFDATSGT